MKISVDLGNIPKAIKELEEYRDSLIKKNKEFLQRLADIGAKEARTRFTYAQYDGDNDVVVEEPEWLNENTIVVRAKGSSVLFIEFGTGVHYSTPVHEKADELGYERGGYGQGRGKNDFWYYRGNPGTNGQIPMNPKLAAKGLVFTHGNPANRCMWEADKKMRAAIRQIAKEVFG